MEELEPELDVPVKKQDPRREELLWRMHPSWKGMIGWYIKWVGLAVLVSALFIYLAKEDHVSAYWAFLVTVFSVGGTIGLGRLIRQATTYEVSNQRITETSGILRKRTEKATMNYISSVVVQQTILDRMLGVGHVNFDTPSDHQDGVDLFDWWGIPDPYKIEQMVNDLRANQSSTDTGSPFDR